MDPRVSDRIDPRGLFLESASYTADKGLGSVVGWTQVNCCYNYRHYWQAKVAICAWAKTARGRMTWSLFGSHWHSTAG